MSDIIKVPTFDELIKSNEQEDQLTVLLNQDPPAQWLKEHKFIKIKNQEGKMVPMKYLPRERLEFMLTRIYRKWYLEVRDVKSIANGVAVTVRLHYRSPVTESMEWMDGVGACGFQTDSGAGAADLDRLKSNAVQMAVPAAETYGFKDACERLGRIFGKDLNLQDIDYSGLMKPVLSLEIIQALFDKYSEFLSKSEKTALERVLKNQEVTSYQKAFDILAPYDRES